MCQNNMITSRKIGRPDEKCSHSGIGFLVGGNHQVLETFSSKNSGLRSSEGVENFRTNHERRMSWTEDKDIGFSMWVFPDPILFHGSMPPGSVQSVFERALPPSLRPGSVYYPLDVINRFEERQSRTDTHYSPLGNLYLGAEVAASMLRIRDEDETSRLRDLSSEVKGYVGDLGVQCSPHVSEVRLRPPQPRGIISASNGLQGGNHGIIQLVTSPNSKSERKLLIFGDSFFRSMLPELARYWRSIVFFRTPFFHYEMVGAIAPDDILCGIAERYFPSARPDTERPHFLSYPLILGRGTAPELGFGELWNEIIDQSALASPLLVPGW